MALSAGQQKALQALVAQARALFSSVDDLDDDTLEALQPIASLYEASQDDSPADADIDTDTESDEYSDFISVKSKDDADPPDPAGPPPVKPPPLPPYDIDLPEEPETVRVVIQEWDPSTRTFMDRDLGVQTLVPTGCDRPKFLSPFENNVVLKTALPRDREKDTNLYTTWMTNGWIDRHWAMEHLDEDIHIAKVDKKIADDMPFRAALNFKPDPGAAMVGQTNGMQDGRTPGNGAPPPPGPGPGAGNKFTAGDQLAKTPQVPPNAGNGTKV